MPATRAFPAFFVKAAPITWPSLSDLASQLYGRARGLDTLGREVRRLRVQTRKIGRDLRIEPWGAVRVLEARGLTVEQATTLVTRIVEARKGEVPAMIEQRGAGRITRPPTSAQSYRDPVVVAASQRYTQLQRPTLVLPRGRADFDAAGLTRAITAGRR